MPAGLACLVALLVAPPVLDDADALGAQISGLARPLIDDGTCVGLAVGVIDGGESLVLGFGEVAGGSGVAPDGETIFEIGSLSKPFTGILLAEMAGRGEVRLDQPLRDLLPDDVAVPSKDDRAITLLDLATHTSGLPRLPTNFRPADIGNPYADYSAEQLLAFLSGHRLGRAPGDRLEYSNLGVGLLGFALARRAGTSYEELLRDRVLDPLGMAETSVEVAEDRIPRFAQGHGGGGDPAPHWDIPTLAGAGGLRSTVDDLLRFVRANLEPDATPLGDAIRDSHEVRFEGPDGSIGLGWFVGPDAPAVRWHNGGTGGFHSFAAFDADRGVGVVVLSNTATFAVDRLGFDLLKALD